MEGESSRRIRADSNRCVLQSARLNAIRPAPEPATEPDGSGIADREDPAPETDPLDAAAAALVPVVPLHVPAAALVPMVSPVPLLLQLWPFRDSVHIQNSRLFQNSIKRVFAFGKICQFQRKILKQKMRLAK